MKMLKNLAIVVLVVGSHYVIAMEERQESALTRDIRSKKIVRIFKDLDQLSLTMIRSTGQTGLSQLNDFLSHMKTVVEENLQLFDQQDLEGMRYLATRIYDRFKADNPAAFATDYNPNTAWGRLVAKTNRLIEEINELTTVSPQDQ